MPNKPYHLKYRAKVELAYEKMQSQRKRARQITELENRFSDNLDKALKLLS